MTLSTEDRLDIHELYGRYAHLIDACDDQWCECFIPTGVLAIPVQGFTAEGHDALRSFARQYHRRAGGVDRHIMSNIVLTVDAGVVSGACYLQVVAGGSGDNPPRLKTTGSYRDLFERTERGWRFARRELSVDTADAASGSSRDVAAKVQRSTRVDPMAHDAAKTATPEAHEQPWRGNLLREHSTWQREFLHLMTDPVWRGRGVPTGDGSPVLLIPGFLSSDSSLSVMHRWLKRVGLRSHRAGIVWNADCAGRAVARLEQRLADIAGRSGRKVHIVGHSRGGLFARALASRCPEHIGQVITLGTPLAEEFDCSHSVAAAVAGARIAQN